jgi:4'-phosphopantetheinyl transferase
MGLLTSSSVVPSGSFALWEITEPIAFFEDKIALFEAERLEISNLAPKRRMEWMATRFLLHEIAAHPERLPCLKDVFGKPYLAGDEHFISLSHSGCFAAAIRSTLPSGIDIQMMNADILRLAPKFMNETEIRRKPTLDIRTYCYMIWSAKEAMYKAYGKKEIDFRAHMTVVSSDFQHGDMFFEGLLKKDDVSLSYSLFCKQFDQLIMVYAVQK